MPTTPAQPDALLGRMESLSDETRLRLLQLLERHELGVVELCDVLQLPQSTVSRHLKVLGNQQWLSSRRQGTTHLYRMLLDELDDPARRLWLLAREQIAPWATLAQDELRLAQVLSGRKNASADFFAAKAEQWDKLRHELYGESFLLDAALAMLPPDYAVADLGCGTGFFTARLAPHVARVLAVDNSPAMLDAARQRIAGQPGVELIRGELTAIPINNDSVDAALVILVLTYVPGPLDVIREAARILKPGGRLIIVDLLPHDREDFRRQMEQLRPGFAPAELSALLTQAGFKQVRVSPLPPAPSAKGPALLLGDAAKASRPSAQY
ncbi:MAG: metalloregulator ArsR/SmtB family transcription factor [Tepidisphaeraceae bacterium]|jgi:ArsR family transcriptional regulator